MENLSLQSSFLKLFTLKSRLYTLLLLFFVAFVGYSQTTPIGLQIKGYERHNELKWNQPSENESLIFDIYRSSGGNSPFAKIGETTDSIYIDFVGAESTHMGWNYKLKSHLQSGATSVFSREVYVENILEMTNEQFLDMVQEYTFRYFWDFAHTTSGLIYESSETVSNNITTSGGTGFGLMAILVGIERGYITRQKGRDRIIKIINFLSNHTMRFHGVWSHWINGENGQVIPFSSTDDGADLVETSFLLLLQGLLTVKEYFNLNDAQELEICNKIQELWMKVKE